MHYFKIDRNISRIATWDSANSKNRQATLHYFKNDRNISKIATGGIASS